METAVATPSSDTKQRLLEAAGEVFAEHGFDDATVRDICERAGANIAAVNYHFQGKERLYSAVLRYAYNAALERFPPTAGVTADSTPRERLHVFIRSMLLRIFDDGRPAWFLKLLSREIFEPTPALDDLVDLAIRPQQQLLLSIIRSIVPDCDEVEARLFMHSILGQTLFYHNCRSVVERTFALPLHDRGVLDQIAEHITEVSFVALQSRRSHAGGRR